MLVLKFKQRESFLGNLEKKLQGRGSDVSLLNYRYLKTYAKFTFGIKPPGHVSDENFLYYCMHLASKISSYDVWNIVKTKDSLLFIV